MSLTADERARAFRLPSPETASEGTVGLQVNGARADLRPRSRQILKHVLGDKDHLRGPLGPDTGIHLHPLLGRGEEEEEKNRPWRPLSMSSQQAEMRNVKRKIACVPKICFESPAAWGSRQLEAHYETIKNIETDLG